MDWTSPREVLLTTGKWMSATEFAKLIANKRNVSERQAKTIISEAYSKGEIKKHVFPDRTVIYGLAEFGPPTSELTHCTPQPEKESVRKALEELRHEFRFFKEPTVKQVARRVGLHPELVESILYELAPQTEWEEPPEKPEKEAEDAINLAGWLCRKQKTDQKVLEMMSAEAINNASPNTERRAENIIKNYPDLIPVVDGTQLKWPEETERCWRKIFCTRPPSYPYWGPGGFFLPH